MFKCLHATSKALFGFGYIPFQRKFCKKSESATIIRMKYLNVAEKNDAAKTIAGFLSKGGAQRREGYSVYNKIFDFGSTVLGRNVDMIMTSVSGHLLSLEFPISYKSWKNVDPLQLFDAPVNKFCAENYQPIKKTLEREIRKCQGLIIWTDCDREGENIGFEIIEVCRAVKPNIRVLRAKFSEITANGVHRALAGLVEPDELQSKAVDIRTELDLRTGAAITRFQTLRLQRLFPERIADKLISYGSCQIPTLGFVVERYKEVEAFVSEPFWKIKVIHTIDDLTVEFVWARNRLFDKDTCEDFFMLCLAEPQATVDNVTVKPKNKWRPVAMDTLELEKLGSRKLKLSAKETMSIAEKLYTKGLISYPRTETNIFSSEINLRGLVEHQVSHSEWGEFASRVLSWGPNPRNGSKSDQAHPPIHPTKMVNNLNGDEARVYELIVRHFLACVSKDATGSETVVNITISGEKFTATGLCIYERNYLDIYIYEKWNAKQIHRYEINQVFEPTEISMQEGATTAPPLLTEADLIILMDKHGIGTDATHAEHINTIKERGYVGVVDRGFLVPGVIGMGLYESYDAMNLALAKPMLRAEFENDLKRICAGEKNAQSVLREQIIKYKEAYKLIAEKVAAMDETISKRLNEIPQHSNIGNQNENRFYELFKCPKCTAQMALKIKKDKASWFITCLNFPNCKNTVWMPDDFKEINVAGPCSRCGPESNKLKIKFKSVVHRAMFDVPADWYVTCLRCDSKFRDTFNINIDQIKSVGRIISESSSRITTSNELSSEASGSVLRSLSLSSNANSVPGTQRQSKNKDSLKTKTKVPRTKKNKSITQTSAPTDLFAEDDGFDDLLVESVTNAQLPNDMIEEQAVMMDLGNLDWDDWDVDQPATTETTVLPISENERREPVSWGNALNVNNRSEPRSNLGTSGVTTTTSSWGSTSFDSAENENNAHAVKCTGCHMLAKQLIVKKEGPNKGRVFYSCPKPNPCKFFQWDDELPSNGEQASSVNVEPSSSNAPTTDVQCSCNQVAKSLIVRKEGPNKARSFYVCSNQDRSCGFFQWADESNSNQQPSTSAWGRNGTSHTAQASNFTSVRTGISSTSRNRNEEEPKKRKCGLCRMEGHTKLKCPRKNEFSM